MRSTLLTTAPTSEIAYPNPFLRTDTHRPVLSCGSLGRGCDLRHEGQGKYAESKSENKEGENKRAEDATRRTTRITAIRRTAILCSILCDRYIIRCNRRLPVPSLQHATWRWCRAQNRAKSSLFLCAARVLRVEQNARASISEARYALKHALSARSGCAWPGAGERLCYAEVMLTESQN